MNLADWQIFIHYSGALSFAKGLLVLDDSSTAMQLTSEDCKLRTKMGAGGEWLAVGKPTLFNGRHNGTAINVSFLHEQGSTYFHFLMKKGHRKHGKEMKEIAKLKVTCSPKHMVNSWISMAKDEMRFVSGQMGGKSLKSATSVLFAEKGAKKFRKLRQKPKWQDDEFESKETWTELGGSPAAASYLKRRDETGFSLLSVRPCTHADKMEAEEICAKHFHSFDFMHHPSDVLQNAMADCVTDLCSGPPEAREVQAELEAEVLRN